MGNILQNSLDVTYEDFLKGVFGVKFKPERTALKSLFSEIVTGRSTLVSDLSKPLRENASKAECKRVQERVSGWLGNYDFVEATGGWLLKNILEDRLDGCTFAVDFSDISKVFGAMLHVHTGDRRVKIRCKPGVVQYCKDLRSKDAATEDVRVLVVESRFDEKLIYLYAVCPDWVLESPAQMALPGF